MKNSFSQLAAIAALIALMVLTACSNDRLSDYSEHMNPIFQAHSGEFALANDALDDMLACAPTVGELMFTDCGTDFIAALDRYERSTAVHMNTWVLELQPPDEALLFHELTLELFQLRRAAFYTLRSQTKDLMDLMEGPPVRNVAAYVAGMEQTAERAADQFDRADRLLPRILAEARKLGGVSISYNDGF